MKTKRILKIAVVGAESTGKTWLCRQLAGHYRTAWVPEYAREYFNDSDIYDYSLDDLARIAERQMAAEDEAEIKADRFLFCDTTLITLKIWAELEFRMSPAIISENLSRPYDLFLVTASDIPWEKDPLRQNKHSRDLLMRLNLEEVRKTGQPFAVVEGQDEQRLQTAIRAIDALFG